MIKFFIIVAPFFSLYILWCIYDINQPLDNFKLSTVYVLDKQTGAQLQEYDLVLEPYLKISVKRDQLLMTVRSGHFIKTADIKTNRYVLDSQGKEILENSTNRFSITGEEMNVTVLFDVTPAMALGPATLKVVSLIQYRYNVLSWLSPKIIYREDVNFTIVEH